MRRTSIRSYIFVLFLVVCFGVSIVYFVIQMRKQNQIWQIERDQMRKYAEIAVKPSSLDSHASDYDSVYAVFKSWWEYTYSGSNLVPPQSPSPVSVSVPSSLTLGCKKSSNAALTSFTSI